MDDGLKSTDNSRVELIVLSRKRYGINWDRSNVIKESFSFHFSFTLHSVSLFRSLTLVVPCCLANFSHFQCLVSGLKVISVKPWVQLWNTQKSFCLVP